MLLSLALCMAACDNVPAVKGGGDCGRDVRNVSFRLEVDDAGKCYETRSVLSSDDIETKITDITLAAYDENGIISDVRYYEAPFSEIILVLESVMSYRIYALANMGDMRGFFPVMKRDVENIVYEVPSYEDVDEKGIPMCGIYGLPENERAGKILLDRLFAKLNVRILHSGLKNYAEGALYAYNMSNKSMYVRQANRVLRPFRNGGSRAEGPEHIMRNSDSHADMDDRNAYEGHLDISQLGPGPGYFQDTTFVFYVPENVQGKLLPQNTDPSLKTYGSIADIEGQSYGDLCTYLEFNAYNGGTQGYSGDIMYRYYLGADNVSDFSLERNCRYDLILDFSEEGFFMNGWKVTRGANWNDRRGLHFLKGSYTVSPGRSRDVLVHFTMDERTEGNSSRLPDRWTYLLDEEAMNEAGLTVSFDPNTLVTGEKYQDYCLKISAASDAEIGSSFPMTVRTVEGGITDHSVISVVEESDFIAEWDRCPEYLCQKGSFSVAGYDESELPLQFSVSDPTKLKCVMKDDDTFDVVPTGIGKSSVTVITADGARSVTAYLNVWAPELVTGVSEKNLNPDGGSGYVPFEYRTMSGEVITDMDAESFDDILRPVVSGSGFFSSKVSGDNLEVFVRRLQCDGNRIVAGGGYALEVKAVNCAHVLPSILNVNVIDPFVNVSVRDYGKIHDYTLFSLSDADTGLSEEFSDEIRANASFSWPGPVVLSDPSCVDAVMTPRWTGNFSSSNGVYILSRSHADGTISVRQKSVTGAVSHSAGLHDVMISVRNRYTSEKISVSCGKAEVYVHSAIGAEAVFGKQMCRYTEASGSRTFADVYNGISLSGTIYQNPQSSDYIHYIDVSMKWLTPVDGVYLFNMAGRHDNSYGGLKFIQPSLNDGEVVNRQLYSARRSSGDERSVICGESYGTRAGVGRLLYRSLLVTTYDRELSQENLDEYFFNYHGVKEGLYAPAYSACSSSGEKVPTTRPYDFSPSSCSAYVDSDGKGYHVIHFLESIYPDSCGWINFL